MRKASILHVQLTTLFKTTDFCPIVRQLKGSSRILLCLTRAEHELKKLLDVVHDVAEELYTGTQAARTRYEERTAQKEPTPTTILDALKHLTEDVSELTVGLDAFAEFAPEVASEHIEKLRLEIEVCMHSS
jgi:hypothetical protein